MEDNVSDLMFTSIHNWFDLTRIFIYSSQPTPFINFWQVLENNS